MSYTSELSSGDRTGHLRRDHQICGETQRCFFLNVIAYNSLIYPAVSLPMERNN